LSATGLSSSERRESCLAAVFCVRRCAAPDSLTPDRHHRRPRHPAGHLRRPHGHHPRPVHAHRPRHLVAGPQRGGLPFETVERHMVDTALGRIGVQDSR
jgi:hypothetical protein